MKATRNALSLLLAAAMMLSLSLGAFALSDSGLNDAITDTAGYVHLQVKSPQVGSIGGEWAILGLARSGQTIPMEYYQNYYAAVEEYVKACKGVLHEKKYTEYARVAVALTAIGKDPTNVAGYNLLTPLGDYEKTIWQGTNGPIWALIALDSGNYAMPTNTTAKTQATRQLYVDRILASQLPDGGWSLFGGTSSASANETSDPDITGMALQALSNYQSQPEVKAAIDKALTAMSKAQGNDGGFSAGSTTSTESMVQMIVGLSELSISLDDSRFIKNGKTILDCLMTHYTPKKGFIHAQGVDGSNQMATEQGLYAMVAVQRLRQGKNSLYDMKDALSIGSGTTPGKGQGLPSKNQAVKAVAITKPGTTFSDISGHSNQAAIEALASRVIIQGKGGDLFDPNANMTRAEFAAIIVRALGLTPAANNQFTDVAADQWYAPFIGTAFTLGIVNGNSETTFNPMGTISRQEAAAMVARAAALCGMDTKYDETATRDILASFSDYTQSAQWACPALAFCYDKGILNSDALAIQPTVAILRCEIAQMLYNLLGSANLL